MIAITNTEMIIIVVVVVIIALLGALPKIREIWGELERADQGGGGFGSLGGGRR